MNRPLRIVIAEDDYIVREGIRSILSRPGEVDVVATVGSTAELLDAARRLTPDAIMTDIVMPASPTGPIDRMAGITAAHTIRATHPGIAIVVLSQYADSMYAVELLRNGAAGLGYVLKDRVAEPDALREALSKTIAGDSHIDPKVVDTLIHRPRSGNSRFWGLSERELEVLQHMAQGHSNPGIASTLHITVAAVEKHVTAIFRKLNLSPEPTKDRRVTAVLQFLRAFEG